MTTPKPSHARRKALSFLLSSSLALPACCSETNGGFSSGVRRIMEALSLCPFCFCFCFCFLLLFPKAAVSDDPNPTPEFVGAESSDEDSEAFSDLIAILKVAWLLSVSGFDQVLLQLDPFLNELTSMFERSTEKGSVWVQRNKLLTSGEAIEYRCLIRATDGKKTISTSVGPKDHQRFQASYATILKAHMTALKKRERKDKKKPAETDKREGSSKRPKKS
ncbi:Signal recognition particle 14 kDa protein [Mucuna pruriens]|uniref:Signal recognition particle 14 kDa protein n=1 Tax=Mucuna pruriens TaxID=157652 RepID=A0A371HTX9_MUCPR|nr:Signal recognition particle 14 kDa protein [Mucuna pruriens]